MPLFSIWNVRQDLKKQSNHDCETMAVILVGILITKLCLPANPTAYLSAPLSLPPSLSFSLLPPSLSNPSLSLYPLPLSLPLPFSTPPSLFPDKKFPAVEAHFW
jgi:hypothetical protein